jgi:hypothetical protein
MFVQVVGTLFDILLDSKDKWLSQNRIQKMPRFGAKDNLEPQSLSIDYKTMKVTAINEFKHYEKVLQVVLPPPLYSRLEEMYRTARINIGMDLWAKIVYEMLYQYDASHRTAPVIEAMKPLYFGRVVTFIRQTLDMDHHASEQEIRKQARHFYRKKEYLTRMYDGRLDCF